MSIDEDTTTATLPARLEITQLILLPLVWLMNREKE